MSRKPTIVARKNGPYLVTHCQILKGSADGKVHDTAGTVALCRCGGSANKPFCDGTHNTIGFTDGKAADRVPDKRENYVGAGVTLHDNRGICAHMGYCTDQLPAVWRTGTEPWIDPDGAAGERVAEQTRRCPSGALSHSVDGVEHRDQERSPTIQVVAAGPYFVTGGIELQHTEGGEGASREHYTLCRCGRSKNKPFCDGTHWYVDFTDPGLDTSAAASDAEETDKETV